MSKDEPIGYRVILNTDIDDTYRQFYSLEEAEAFILKRGPGVISIGLTETQRSAVISRHTRNHQSPWARSE
jgi:hypothetical protein